MAVRAGGGDDAVASHVELLEQGLAGQTCERGDRVDGHVEILELRKVR